MRKWAPSYVGCWYIQSRNAALGDIFFVASFLPFGGFLFWMQIGSLVSTSMEGFLCDWIVEGRPSPILLSPRINTLYHSDRARSLAFFIRRQRRKVSRIFSVITPRRERFSVWIFAISCRIFYKILGRLAGFCCGPVGIISCYLEACFS